MKNQLNSSQEINHQELKGAYFIEGPNFSGRSLFIHEAAVHISNEDKQAVILSSELEAAFSGLMEDTETEISLHQSLKDDKLVNDLIDVWSLTQLLKRNPYTLSGGEQTLVALLCKLVLRPDFLALDCCLEQLDPENLSIVMKSLIHPSFHFLPKSLLIAHNTNLATPFDSRFFSKVNTFAEMDSVKVCKIKRVTPPSPNHSVNLKIENWSFAYPKVAETITGINMSLKSGKVYRLAGPNGVGKSTLAQLLCGILKPKRGKLYANEQPLNAYKNPGQLVRLHFQSPTNQLFGHSVAEEISTLSPDQQKLAIEFAGLSQHLKSDPFDLPFVLRKRLALSIVLFSAAPWLILDEPTLGQDEESQQIIADIICDLARSGHGVIVISHNKPFVERLSAITIDLKNI